MLLHAGVDARRSQPTSATRGRKLATVAQPCGYPVDGQVDCLHHAVVGIAGPVTLQQFDLYMVERLVTRGDGSAEWRVKWKGSFTGR